MTLLKIEGVEKRYRQGEVDVDALTAIDLQIDCGEFVALVGPSGSGKTTLLNLIGGLDRADRGSIQLNGVELTSMEETALSQFRLTEIGFVFQAYNLVPVLSALENVELVMVLQGVPPQQCRARAIEYLQRVGLESMMDRRPAALSGRRTSAGGGATAGAG